MKDFWYKVLHFFGGIVSDTSWRSWRRFLGGTNSALSDKEIADLKILLAKNYYVILTFNKTHLSNWFINLMCWVKTGKPGTYAHVLMNVDNVTDPNNPDGFKLMEATHKGVGWASFNSVFNCDRVCLLRPKNLPIEEWTAIIDRLIKTDKIPYDDFYDLADSNRMSCVEVVRYSLQASQIYDQVFPTLEQGIEDLGNLTPQMFRDCQDFNVELEVIR